MRFDKAIAIDANDVDPNDPNDTNPAPQGVSLASITNKPKDGDDGEPV